MHIIFFIVIHYNTFKISNISCGFELLIIMTIYSSVVLEPSNFYGDRVVIYFVYKRCEKLFSIFFAEV